ncbi:hypothetical protein PACTADRAFT_48677 [Pachysolen tannophilus NRRL Y-2460]|uniref:Uncharacterized protein n=1 Tax=Pachysolen tannophilus NRRL Y-2460 TaxID=669874 RepID=A0A1E4TYP8_PACTA|nr:hypothetical protein PACTADRAFT_48677 [Pachysolen tannophilus NRRL Y-2460]
MEFLNSNFKSLADLKKIDSIINDLNVQRDELAKRTSNVSGDDDELIFDNNSQQVIIDLVSDLNEIINNFVNSKVDFDGSNIELNKLVTKYGNVNIIKDLRFKLDQVQQLISAEKIIKDYNLLLNNVNNLLVVVDQSEETILQETSDVFEKVQNFKKLYQSYMLVDQLGAYLDRAISEVIVNTFKQKFEIVLERLIQDTESGEEGEEEDGKEIQKEQNEKQSIEQQNLIIKSLRNLLILQSIDPLNSQKKPLWAFSLLSQPFQIRFVFHYETKNETNRIDKPEWFLKYLNTWLTNNLDDLNKKYSIFLKSTIYEKEYFKTNYLLALLEPVKSRIIKILNVVSNIEDKEQSSFLLTHLIDQLQKSDEEILRNHKIAIDLTNDLILSNDMYFNKWLNIEKTFNFKRFNEIIYQEDSFEIDFESVESSLTKPTKSSIYIKNLFENLTLKYKSIANYKFKLKFLSEIQLNLLSKYYDKLDDSLSAFQSIFKKISLLKSNHEEEYKITGLNGIDKLLRIYCSLRYIIEAMENWDEDLVFIELWLFINDNDEKTKEEVLSGTFFQPLVEAYEKLSLRVVNILNEFLNREINSSFKSYFKLNNWGESNSFNDSLSPELSSSISKMSRYLDYINRSLSEVESLTIKNNFCERIIKFFKDSILNLNQFNENGSKQLLFDFENIFQTLGLIVDLKQYRVFKESLIVLSSVDDEFIMNNFKNYQDLREFLKRSSNADLAKILKILNLNYVPLDDMRNILYRRK